MMSTTVTDVQRAGYVGLLTCCDCRSPVLPRTDRTAGRVYDCRLGCRTEPINAAQLDHEIHRALAGTIALENAKAALARIVVAGTSPVGVHLVWKLRLPDRPQPHTTRPLVAFARRREGRPS